MDAIAQGTFGELFPFTGQAAGLVGEVLPDAKRAWVNPPSSADHPFTLHEDNLILV